MHQLIQPLHITRRVITTLIALSIAGLPQISRAQGKVFILTLEGFEKSQFFKSYKTLSKSNYPLKTGGTNYSYGFADTDGTNQKISVELSSAPSFLTRLGISFYGSSLSSPATFSQSREKFLRDLLSSTHPDIPIEKVIELVKSEQRRAYDGGSTQMPRIPIGNTSVFIGTVGADLIVGLSR